MPEKDKKGTTSFAEIADLFPKPTVYTMAEPHPNQITRELTPARFEELPLNGEGRQKAQARVAEILEQKAEDPNVDLKLETVILMYPERGVVKYQVRIGAVRRLDGEEIPEENPLTLPVQVE
jgi:hypothetical protein